MLILRIIGAWLIIGAIVAFVVDGTRTLGSDSGFVMTPLGEYWFKFHAASLNTAQAAIERHVHPFLWDPVISWILQLPAWVVLGVLGLLIYWIGRRRRPTSAYAN